jgi:hypothetical protein
MWEQFLQDAPDLKLVINWRILISGNDTLIPEKSPQQPFPPERLLEVHVSDNNGNEMLPTPASQTTLGGRGAIVFLCQCRSC